jgi:hypothetical protein
MFLTIKHKAPALLALLLSAVLLGSVLAKPVHILLVHHDVAATLKVYSDFGVLSNSHQSCSICDFEFCSFIPQSQVDVPKINVNFAKEINPATIACRINQAPHHFQLRAPPAL